MSIAIKQADISDYTVIEVVESEETEVVPENAGAVVIVKGEPGEDGFSPDISVEKTENGHKVTVTDKDGQESFDVDNGDIGPVGPQGLPGKTPNIQIGEVITLEPGTEATASITGTAEEPRLNLGIPQGKDGEGGGAEVTAESVENALGYIPANPSDIPTKTSQLKNDSGFITKDDIPATPEVPVKSVFGRTGTVVAQSGDYTAEMVGADKEGKAVEEVGKHNTSENAHNDIRVELTELRNALEAFLDIDDPTLDQLSELIQKIEANAGTITELTNGKVNIADIVNNLTTNVANKPLSAAQGVVLKGLVDNLTTVSNNAATTAGNAATTANEAKSLATTADTNAKNAVDTVNNMQERMDSGEFKGETGKTGPQGNPGADGVSIVSVEQTTTSIADGGENVVTVTLSNGVKSTFIIKNGSKGADGKNGTNGTDGKDYVITATDKQEIKSDIVSQIVTQEAGESESLVMSQKAVTDLVADALGTGGGSTEYETVDSIEDMVDTSKQYVLSSTGTIWAYGEITTEVEPPNKFVPSTATISARLSGSSGSVSGTASTGSFVTDFIAVSDMANVSPYNARLNWELVESAENKVVYFNSSKTRLGNTIFHTRSNITLLDNETVLDLKKMDTASTHEEPTWADVAYVRFQLYVKEPGTALTSEDIADCKITFDHEGGTKTENAWYDTGLTPSASGDGGNYVTLLAKVEKNKSDISEVSNRVTALESGSDTVTVPTFWQNAVDACVAKIKALQKDAGISAITFPFFSDNHQRNGYAGILIKAVMDKCHIPYAFFGGDSISNGYIETEEEMIEQQNEFDTTMSPLSPEEDNRAAGNHDGYWKTSAGVTNYYTRAQVFDLFFRKQAKAQTKHFGADGTYFYVDDITSKVRFIVLNTNGGSVDSTQISWLQNTALSFAESGWSVVFISHQPISNHYHAGISNAAEVRTIVANYINGSSANKADIVGWFSGHIHRDRIYTGAATNTTDDSEGEAMGFTQVTITSDHTGIAYDDATKHTVASDDQSHAIDFVTINKAARTVNITRLGIGEDRSFTY